MGRGSRSQVVGFRYYLGLMMGISRGPVDELIEIKVGDKPAWRGSVTGNTSFVIDQPNLFGGEDKEGGIQGTFSTMFGGPTQTAPSFLATILPVPMPGFRRMFTAFFDGIVTMGSAYPKPWKFRVRRALAGWDGATWYPERAVIQLVREISAAEQQENFDSVAETTDVSTTEQVFGYPPNGYNPYDGIPNEPQLPFTHTLTIPNGGTFTAIQEVYGGQGDTAFPINEGTGPGTYSRVGATLTFASNLYGIQIQVGFEYALTTIPPGSVGLGTYGTGLIVAMNPAHILYECYTNREWGRGLQRERMDDAAWRAVADTLFTERFGMCIRWTRKDEIQTFIQMVIDHIGATVFVEPATGLITPRLIRNDYVREDLPLFDASTGLIEISDAPVSAQGPLINEVQVTYHDVVSDQDRTVRHNNPANFQASGGQINLLVKNYPGIPIADLAARLAKRDLRAAGTTLRKFDLVFDRRGSSLVPGGLVRIQDLSRNIKDTVLRIGSVDYGTLADGKVKVKAAQDVFGLPARGLPTQPPPPWRPPSARPCLGPTRAFELPYHSVFRGFTPAEFATIEDDVAFFGLNVGQGQPLNTGFTIAIKPGAVISDELAPDESYYCGYLPPVSAQWSPIEKDDDITLQLGNRRQRGLLEGLATFNGARGVTPKTSGRWYVEFSLGANAAPNAASHYMGIVLSEWTSYGGVPGVISSGFPSDYYGWMLSSNGYKYHAGSIGPHMNGDPFDFTDLPGQGTTRIGMAVDIHDGIVDVYFSTAGVWRWAGNPSAGINPALTGAASSPIYLAGVMSLGAGIERTLTLHSLEGDTLYAPPATYERWD